MTELELCPEVADDVLDVLDVSGVWRLGFTITQSSSHRSPCISHKLCRTQHCHYIGNIFDVVVIMFHQGSSSSLEPTKSVLNNYARTTQLIIEFSLSACQASIRKRLHKPRSKGVGRITQDYQRNWNTCVA